MNINSSFTKNLVMGFATNQPEESVRTFCESVRRIYNSDECDIRIVTNRYEPYFDDLARRGVRFDSTPNNYSSTTSKVTKAVNRLFLHAFRLLNSFNRAKLLPEIAEAYPILLETWHHPQIIRWFAYYRILSVNCEYKYVFFADVKDVVFQGRFFEGASDDKVTLFADGNRFGHCYWNDKWYKEAYGNAAFKEIIGSQPVCIGTVLGGSKVVLKVLEEFTAFLARFPFGRIEQAMFNHMLLTEKFSAKCEIEPNISGVVATLASEHAIEQIKLIDGAICRANDNSIIPVVHMYDRWPETRDIYREKVGQSGSSPQKLSESLV